jgi:hypothetical protein
MAGGSKKSNVYINRTAVSRIAKWWVAMNMREWADNIQSPHE